jgi:chemotaxis protein methyltransferase CheR
MAGEIGIVETKAVIKLIIEKYGIDFSDYALTSFKQRIERIIDLYNLKYSDILINRLNDDAAFFEYFLYEMAVPSTEMFRDPSFWRTLRDEVIPGIYRENGTAVKIWLPGSVSGDELFSIAIVLHELDLLEKSQIIVSCISKKHLEIMQSGLLNSSKLEVSTDNYIRANGMRQLSDYLVEENNNYYRDKRLIKNVSFFIQDVNCEPLPQNIKLVLFRNKMIYFNQVQQNRVIKNIHQAMGSGGILTIGIQEALGQFFGLTEFTALNEHESIYKRT